MDNAATTKVYPEVVELISKVLSENYGNPSSIYKIGTQAGTIIKNSRESIAKILNCSAKEIYFTSCGTESINWAIKGAAAACKGGHIISTKIEHHAVLNTLRVLEKDGYEVTYLDAYENGIICPGDFQAAVRPDTILAAVMLANNEIGTIQPLREIAQITRARKIPLFTDAVQAVGHIPVDIAELGVDMLAFSGHKFGGPKGVGGLYIKTGTYVRNLLDGGGQERGKRGGTENTAGIAALAKALELSVEKMSDNQRVEKLRNRLIESILAIIPHSRLNGDRYMRLPGNVSVCFEFIEGESLLLLLDIAGICASTGSACSSVSLDVSHVLKNIGVPEEIAHGSLRLSLSYDTTDEDVDYVLEKLAENVLRLRQMSPLYKG